MMFRAAILRGVFSLAVVILLGGCNPPGSGLLDEEKEPHFLAGKECISTLDWKGAIECFDKALQVNPRSASAHFELAWLFDAKDPDPAAAIYHYEHFLQLRPNAENADLAKQRILVCKQALAQTVSLGPVTERVQRQFEQIAEENKRLTEENKRLRDDVEKWSGYAARLQALTNQVSNSFTAAPRAGSTPVLAQAGANPAAKPVAGESSSSHGSASNAAARTHTIKPGETPIQIARRYSIKLETLMAANPGVDARHLKVGQSLRIPGS